jgi:tRNA(Ile2) C34 agmatinyltransferase TiaS
MASRWRFHSCPKCNGDLYPEGETYQCFQCSRLLNPRARESIVWSRGMEEPILHMPSNYKEGLLGLMDRRY